MNRSNRFTAFTALSGLMVLMAGCPALQRNQEPEQQEPAQDQVPPSEPAPDPVPEPILSQLAELEELLEQNLVDLVAALNDDIGALSAEIGGLTDIRDELENMPVDRSDDDRETRRQELLARANERIDEAEDTMTALRRRRDRLQAFLEEVSEDLMDDLPGLDDPPPPPDETDPLDAFGEALGDS